MPKPWSFKIYARNIFSPVPIEDNLLTKIKINFGGKKNNVKSLFFFSRIYVYAPFAT